MGKGYEFTKKEALDAARILLQKLIADNTVSPQDCQVGLLNSTRTQATLPDGSTIDVVPEGLPGTYALICNGLVVVPEPTQVNISGQSNQGYVLGFDEPTNEYYLRKIGSPNIAIIPKTLPITGEKLDDRIQLSDRGAKLASDGKALMIGGFYQDIPADYNFFDFENSNDNAYNGTPVPGYTYHTFANWIIFTGISITFDNATSTTTFSYTNAFFGQKDLTEEAADKIPAPVQQGVGSSQVYRLFPSQADLYLPSLNTATGAAGYAHARFFPAAYETFTTVGDSFSFLVAQGLAMGQPEFVTTSTSGEKQTYWINDGHTYPLFMGKDQPWGCTPSNLVFAFNIDSTTGNYVLDIVSDISYGTSYQIALDRIQTYNTWTFNLASGPFWCGNSLNCYSTQIQQQNYTNILENPTLYPFIPPFHNLHTDEYIINGITNVTGPIFRSSANSPYGFPQINYASGGDRLSFGPLSCFSHENGTTIATSTYFGDLCSSAFSDFPCLYFFITTTGDGGGAAGSCTGPGLTQTCHQCGYVSTGNYQITDWDGTFFSINDYGPLFTNAGLSGFFIFLRDGGCNPPSCPGSNNFMSVLDSFFFTFSGGFFDAYRFGRGICAFNNIANIVPLHDFNNSYQSQDIYEGPSIVVSRLMSPLSQNHLYQVFRGPAGQKACTYQIADTYASPDANAGTVLGYQDLINELDNPLAYDGVDVIDSDIQNQVPVPGGSSSFSAFCFATNYTDEGIFVNQANFEQPPDVMTDKVLAPFGTWPFTDELLKGVDSYIIQGYSVLQTTNDDQTTTTREYIVTYTVDSTGLTEQTKVTSGLSNFQNEIVMDYLSPIKVEVNE